MKNSFILFALILSFFSSCKKTEPVDMDLACPVAAGKGLDSDITGKWKLLKVSTVYSNLRTVDYSCDDVVYHFRSDGTLTISSDIHKNMITKEPVKYTFSLSPLYANMKGFTLKRNGSSVPCKISAGIMILDSSPVDGPIEYFARM